MCSRGKWQSLKELVILEFFSPQVFISFPSPMSFDIFSSILLFSRTQLHKEISKFFILFIAIDPSGSSEWTPKRHDILIILK